MNNVETALANFRETVAEARENQKEYEAKKQRTYHSNIREFERMINELTIAYNEGNEAKLNKWISDNYDDYFGGAKQLDIDTKFVKIIELVDDWVASACM